MKKLLRSATCPERARGLVLSMAFFLVLSSLLAPVMPVVDAATISNAQFAQQAAALQDDGSDATDSDGADAPPSDDGASDGMTGDDGTTDGMDATDDSMDGMDGTDATDDSMDGMDGTDGSTDGMDGVDDSTDGMDGDDGTMDGMDDPMDQTPKDAILRVHVAWCPVQTELSSAEFSPEQMLSICTKPGPDVTVAVMEAGGTAYFEQTTSSFNYMFTFQPLHQTHWNIDVKTVPYIDEFFACEGYHYDNGNRSSNTKPYASVFRSQTTTPMYPLTTIQDPQSNLEEQIDCYWFGQMRYHGIVHLNKVFCPEGIRPNNETFEYLYEQCQLTSDAETEFLLSSGTSAPNYPLTVHLNPANNYQHTIYDAPAGGLYVDERGTSGYRLGGIYCLTTDWQNLNDNMEYESMSLEGDSSYFVDTYTFSEKDCVLFNVALPVADARGDEDVDDEGEYGTLYITKMLCPEGIVGTNQHEYAPYCLEWMEGVGFSFSPEAGNGSGQYYPTDAQGMLIRELAPGNWTVIEQLDQNYQLAAVFCMPPEEGDNTWIPQQISGNQFSIEIVADATHNCLLFNAPYEGDDDVDEPLVGVYVTKYQCHDMMPDGEMDPYAWYTTNCTTYQSDIGFGLSVYLGGPVGSGTTDSNGYAVLYEGAPASGEYLINERGLPDGYSAVAAFCRDVAFEGQTSEWMQYDITNNGIQVPFAGNHGKECLWFNYGEDIFVPQQEPLSNLTIYKWICPGGYDYMAQGADPMVDCNTPAPAGITFTVSDTDPNTSDIETSTGDQSPGNGLVYFGGLVPGMHTITETQLPEFDSAFLWDCDGYQNQISQPISTGWSYQMDVPSGQEITCHWMNVAAEYQGVSLTINKWQCPVGTMYGQMESYYSAECATQHPGVPFSITDDNGTQNTTSDTNGRQLNGRIGEITITETIPAGYTVPVVFCHEMNNGSTDVPASTVTNGSVTLSASQYGYQCFWYNMPAEEHSLTIYKWQCPAGVTYAQVPSYYSAECAMEHPGVPFQITHDGGTIDTTSDTNGRQIDNLRGQITIRELGLPGYGDAMVFCQLLNDQGLKFHQPVNGVVTLVPAVGDDYQCFWYNIPLEDFSLTLYKWQCPEGTMYGQMADYYSAECAMEHPGVPFQITSDNGTVDFMSDTNGYQVDNLRGQVILREMGLPGYGDPVVYCQLLNDMSPTLYTSTNGIVMLPPAMGDDYQCFWYNIPEPESTVTIYKYRCPDGMPAEYSQSWFEMNCGTPMDVDFSLVDSKGPRMMSTMNGMVQWTDVATGAVQVTEHIPMGYTMQPYLVCVVIDPAGMPSAPFSPATVNGTWHTTITAPGTEIRCDWYNWYLGPGDITVHKRICPEGYDRHAWNADPMMDCTETVNGITFKLDQPDPEVDLFSDTGDSMDSAVYFGGLTPGDYVLTEMVGPGEYQDIFVWQCYGLNMSSVHPTPLSVGQSLDIKIVGGDDIVCYWFNVPYPRYGYMVVTKYNCSTEKWVSDVYCYTNQMGQYFDLQMWNGSTWSTVQSGTTDVSGKVTFNMLDAGEYRLIEPNKQACLMKSSNITSGGNIGVSTGEGTTVYVYNCKTPPPPQKTPTKYPNTGIGPAAESAPVRLPGLELTGLAGLLGLAMNRRRMVAGAGLVTAGAAATALPLLNAQELVPLDSTPAPGTPAPDVFWCATPTAGTPVPEGTPVVDPCNRGPIPMQMRIPVIEVDAPIEYLEIIDGLMQQPTGDSHIAWYKETSRLGEVGNGIYAAHVNWYGNPEGIFFRLESLQEGDVIEIDGDNLQTYLFEVQWMQNFPSDEEPPDEALGLTDEVAITLITCGGEWSSALSEYDHRTLVRAVLRE